MLRPGRSPGAELTSNGLSRVTQGTNGIKKPRKPDPLNDAEPAIPPQKSPMKTKNCSQAMKEAWAWKRAQNVLPANAANITVEDNSTNTTQVWQAQLS